MEETGQEEWELRLELSGVVCEGLGKGGSRGPSLPFYRQQTEAQGGLSLPASQRPNFRKPNSEEALAALCPAEFIEGHHPVLLEPGLPAAHLQILALFLDLPYGAVFMVK